MSFLAPYLKAYLEFKQRLGYTSFAKTSIAKDIDYYLVFRDITSLQNLDESFIANWIYAVPKLSAGTKNKKLEFARGLFRYLMRLGIAKENPALRIPLLKVRPYQPYAYTLKEIHEILSEARRYRNPQGDDPLGHTLETMLFLIYACGLRLGEATGLRIRDVDFEEDLLLLWNTKFHKERLVPFSKTVAQKLKAYLAIRLKIYPANDSAAPFFCIARKKCHKSIIESYFRKILIRCGLIVPRRRSPRIHDLRHAFAVHRLYKWYQEGHDALNKLPLLSTYMGHSDPVHTQVYLAVTRTLLREGDRRFQNAFEKLAQKAVGRAFKKL